MIIMIIIIITKAITIITTIIDRDSWHLSLRKAGCKFEAERHKAAKEKRRRQKERASDPSSSQTFVCPKCGKGCASRIGLYSHQRACKN